MDSFDEIFIESLVRALVLHKELAFHTAWDNWNSCLDPDSKLKITNFHKRLLVQTRHKIELLKNQLSVQLDDIDFVNLRVECSNQFSSYLEEIEKKIEIDYRPSDVFFNKDALINMTDLPIPDDIQICLSFGYKFLSPYSCNDKNMHSILAQLDQCIDESIPDLKILEASIDIYRILSPRSRVQHDDNKKWLAFIAHRTKAFFKTNPHIFATKSDKGGHTVVISIPDYEARLQSHIREGNYSLMNQDPLQGLIDEEKEIIWILSRTKKLNDFLFDNRIVLGVAFEPNTLNLPKFYGLPKIHKKDMPLRPITTTIGSAGYYLAKLFDRMLSFVFPRTDYHIKDTYEFVKFIKSIRSDDILIPYDEVDEIPNSPSEMNFGEVHLKEDDVLVSFDVVSMFTSIPFELVFDIIMSKAEVFQFSFDIDRFLLARLVSFLLKECMVFTALDKIYKQNDGIPMGSCLSPTVARIVMDKVILHLLDRIPQISFIKVFVDDTIAAVHKDCIDLALNALNDFRPNQIKFTLERENDAASINFLNVTLHRKDTQILTNWFRKSFASGRLLNYYSSHKRTTIIATAVHFIKTVLILSDSIHFQSNKSIVFRTLRDNSFPETTIISLMNEYYTIMKPITKQKDTDEALNSEHHVSQENMSTQLRQLIGRADEEKKGYKIFPHSICEGRRIKKTILTHKAPRVILADSVKNTKINAISTRKTITPVGKRNNLILVSRCICKKKYKIVNTKFNETGDMALSRILTRAKMNCDIHGHAYHKAKFLRGLFYGSQTKYLVKYIAWKYRHALDFDCQPGHPNDRLRKLVKCSCCRSLPQQKVNNRAQPQNSSLIRRVKSRVKLRRISCNLSPD